MRRKVNSTPKKSARSCFRISARRARNSRIGVNSNCVGDGLCNARGSPSPASGRGSARQRRGEGNSFLFVRYSPRPSTLTPAPLPPAGEGNGRPNSVGRSFNQLDIFFADAEPLLQSHQPGRLQAHCDKGGLSARFPPLSPAALSSSCNSMEVTRAPHPSPRATASRAAAPAESPRASARRISGGGFPRGPKAPI